MTLVPYVVERSGREERVFDIYSRLLKDRIIFLQGVIDDNSANLIVAQMLFLQFDDAKTDIHLYINSPGGSVTAVSIRSGAMTRTWLIEAKQLFRSFDSNTCPAPSAQAPKV